MFCLKRLRGKVKERVIIPLTESRVTIGRSFDATIPLLSPLISRCHAILKFEDSQWIIQDVKSLNGIYVNDARIGSGMVQSLKEGDIISLGPPEKTEFQFQYCHSSILDGEVPCKIRIKQSSQDIPTLTKPEDIQDNKNICTQNVNILNSKYAISCEGDKSLMNSVHDKSVINCADGKVSLDDKSIVNCISDKPSINSTDEKSNNITTVCMGPVLSAYVETNDDEENDILIADIENIVDEELVNDDEESVSLIGDIEIIVDEELVNDDEESDSLIGDIEIIVDEELVSNEVVAHHQISTAILSENDCNVNRDSEEAIKKTDVKDVQMVGECIYNEGCSSSSNSNTENNKLTVDTLHALLEEKEKVQEELRQKLLRAEAQLEENNQQQKAKEKESEKIEKEHKQEIVSNILQQVGNIMESELICSICTELFVEATTLNCSHTFCKSCIQLWKENKHICPICRAQITMETKALALNNFIEKMIENLSAEMKEKRNILIQERATLTSKSESKDKSNKNVVNPDNDSDSFDEYDYNSNYGDSFEEGIEGVYYGGYGRCFICGRRGHWARGCPDSYN